MTIMRAMLGSVKDPVGGSIEVPFPIPDDEYDGYIEFLRSISAGDTMEQDCRIAEISSGYGALKALMGASVNIDEMDYLAKRLNSFMDNEAICFEAMAYLMKPQSVQDLINLTICCQDATVISDFNNLWRAGIDHYITTHGGCVPTSEIENLDAEALARELLESGNGQITPYGVAFDNGMKLEEVYCGHSFPMYYYESKILDVQIIAPDVEDEPILLQLPVPEEQMERMLRRSGLRDGNMESVLGIELSSSTEIPQEHLPFMNKSTMTFGELCTLNIMCEILQGIKEANAQDKMLAVMEFMNPETPEQIKHLAEHLYLFDFVPDVTTPAEYGRAILEARGDFEKADCGELLDFDRFGEELISVQTGGFTIQGYIAYLGKGNPIELMHGGRESLPDMSEMRM